MRAVAGQPERRRSDRHAGRVFSSPGLAFSRAGLPTPETLIHYTPSMEARIRMGGSLPEGFPFVNPDQGVKKMTRKPMMLTLGLTSFGGDLHDS
ncbi:MAG: hypothetical protein KDI73_01405 [Candidatus Competibacteraceae bacterium]|nr:hypothetical protein [Candidatus Competibacteraceae bacterium]